MRTETINAQKRKLQNARIMSGKFRAAFLKHPTGQNVLWHLLVYHCGLFQKIHTEEAMTRHNMGIEMLQLCGLIQMNEQGVPQDIDRVFEEIQRLNSRPKKKKWFSKFRRKRK